MLSGMMDLSKAPICEISEILADIDYKPPKNLLYNIIVKDGLDDRGGREVYEPQVGDVIALSNIRPMCVSDLNRPPRSYCPALVVRGDDKEDEEDEEHAAQILAFKPIMGEGEDGDEGLQKKEEHLFAVFLINIMTNMRIWNALHGEDNMNIIKMLLHADSKVGLFDPC